jgi:hypothetical protein
MKKLALTSLLAVFAVSGAHAANMIDGNPMYRPADGNFYSVTTLGSDTDLETLGFAEEFGYGITDKVAVYAATSGALVTEPETDLGLSGFALGASFRAVDMGAWKADVIGEVAQGWLGVDTTDADMEVSEYDWTVGGKVGYVADNWTLAGKVAYTYAADDMDDFEMDNGNWTFGLMGQYLINQDWNINGGVNYNLSMGNAEMDQYTDDEAWINIKTIDMNIGVNYNISETMFVGGYVSTAWGKMSGGLDDNDDQLDMDWEMADPELAFGAKFGIQF